MTSEAKIKAIAPWFGSKRTMGPQIAEQLGRPRALFLLGCGSLAPLFSIAPCAQETCVDLHGHLINLARVLQDDEAAPRLYERLQRTLCSEDLFDKSKVIITDHADIAESGMPSVDMAYHYFVASWVGRNGVAGTERVNYQIAVRWTPNGGAGGVRFRSATESIPAWHQRLRQALLLKRDMFDVLPRIDDHPGTSIYVDPPYVRDGATRCGKSKYLHDFTLKNHIDLANELARFERARVVVSYYDHPKIRQLYQRFTIIDCTRQKNLHVQNRRGAKRCDAPELLIVNGPSYAKGAA